MDDNNENNQFNDIPKDGDNNLELSPEEIRRRRARREQLEREKEQRSEAQDKKKKKTTITLVIFCIILFILALFYIGIKKILPNHLMNQGKKYLQIQQYDNALKMFKMAASSKPYDEEPVYYQVVTLSKMPMTYDTQMALYEISQLEDCDKASEYADNILSNMKRQIERMIGPNYADNVLYDDILFRWNTKNPIKYSIVNNSNAPGSFENEIRRAFTGWSRISNGQILFRETRPEEAEIIVNLVNMLFAPTEQFNNNKISGEMIPEIRDNKLERVNINLVTNFDNRYPDSFIGQFFSLAQHEIGHALGIGGHSSDPNDVMAPSGDSLAEVEPNKQFTPRDINTLTLLYKMVPDVINKPLDKNDYRNLFYHYAITTIPGEEFDNEIQRLLSHLQMNGNDIVKWVDLAINYGIKKQYKRSNSILKNIVPLAKDDANNTFVILYNMAANSYKMRAYNDAERYLKIAEDYNSADLDAAILEAFTDLKLNRKETAKTKLILLNNKYPEHIEIALKLAYIYNSDKDKTKAKETIDKLIRNNRDALNDRRVAKYRSYISEQNRN